MLPAAAYKPAKHSSGAVLFGQLKWPGIEICHKIVKKNVSVNLVNTCKWCFIGEIRCLVR